MKKMLSILIAFILVSLLGACSASKSDSTTATSATATSAAVPTNAQIIAAYNKATKIYFYFDVNSLDVNSNVTVKDAGKTYYKVKAYSTLAQLKAYMETVLSDNLVNNLINKTDVYREFNGVLYSVDGARGEDITLGKETVSVTQSSNSIFTVTVKVEKLGDDHQTVTGYETFKDIYSNINGKWAFTGFVYFR